MLNDAAQAKREEADRLQTMLDGLPALRRAVDVDAIRARLAGRRSERTASSTRGKQLRDRRAEAAGRRSRTLQTRIGRAHRFSSPSSSRRRRSRFRRRRLPIDGLGFKDGVVTFNGKPWDQVFSEAERIDASMSIAMALSPKLKNIIIRDASGVGSKIKQRITRASACERLQSDSRDPRRVRRELDRAHRERSCERRSRRSLQEAAA
jgi:hypothetical protein